MAPICLQNGFREEVVAPDRRATERIVIDPTPPIFILRTKWRYSWAMLGACLDSALAANPPGYWQKGENGILICSRQKLRLPPNLEM